MKKIEEYVKSIPDFPEKGIIFRDVTSVLQDADGLHLAIDEMQKFLEGVDFDVIAGTESRGFIFGVPVAYAMHKGFIIPSSNCLSKTRVPSLASSPIFRSTVVSFIFPYADIFQLSNPTRDTSSGT